MNENKQKSNLIIGEPKKSSINNSEIDHYEDNKVRFRNTKSSISSGNTFLTYSENLEENIDFIKKDNVNLSD